MDGCVRPVCQPVSCAPSVTHPRGHLFQGFQLFVVREVELSDKVIEMLVAGIDVSLSPHLAHTVKVVDVDMDKHPEQTRQNLLSHLHEGLREGSTDVGGEDVLIVDLYLNPIHEQAHVFGG